MKSNKIRQYFSTNKASAGYIALDDTQKKLVDAGVEVVKAFATKKAKGENKKSFIDLMSDVNIDTYKENNDLTVEKIVKYSMEKAGVSVDKDFDISIIKNPTYHKKTSFRETFNEVIAQIMTPVIPAMISADFMDMADTSNIAYGDTARFPVKSNDIFYVTRIAEGILQGSTQRVYNDEITVNPEPYNIMTTIDWYQVAAGVFDLGDLAYRIAISYNAYITQMIIGAIKSYIDEGIAEASPYFTTGFTTQKFTKLNEIVGAANGRANVTCYGPLTALAAILPEQVGLQYGLGEEWTKVGYLASYMGVNMVRMPQILLPNTVNTTAILGIPEDTVYMFADGGYKPVKLVFEGQTVTIDIEPTTSTDKEMGINVTMRFGMGMVVASKFGGITGVTL